MPYDRDRCWRCDGVSHVLIETSVATRPACRSCLQPSLDAYQANGVPVVGITQLTDPAHRGLTPRKRGLF